MSPRVHRRGRIALLAVLLSALAAWFIPSYFSVERYRRRLESGLESALHRHVSFGHVSVRVLPRPGFVIENAVIQEDRAFGFEPFIRVDRIECDVRWQTLLGARLAFSHFRLLHPNINLVRKAGGAWNVEPLLLVISPPSGAPGTGIVPSPPSAVVPDLEVEDGRLNFKMGDTKKALAITDLRAQLSFDPAQRFLRFRIVGSPVRADLSLPTPGAVEVSGEWTPGRDFHGPLSAVVRAREALVYDWAPLVTGHDAGLYGVMDAELRVTGSIRSLNFEGRGRLSDLHRWDLIPPSDPMPCALSFRGQLDRDRGRLLVETAEGSFAGSHIHLSGTVDLASGSPQLDLVLALERSRLEDLAMMAGRLWPLNGSVGIKGRVDGMLTLQGSWPEPRLGGFVGAREVAINTRSATFPVSEIAVRIDNHLARLAPLRITLAPRVALEAEGSLDRSTRPFRYDLTLSSKTAPLRDVLNFGRALGMAALQGWNATGSGAASFHLTGSLPSASRPIFKGRAELRAARLVIPGLAEPINVPRASVEVNGEDIIVDHLQAGLGASVFSGRLEHQGERHNPWTFDLRADTLDVEQGTSWFVAFARRNPIPLFSRLPGLGPTTADPQVASNLFSSVHARGRFSASKLTFRMVKMDNLQTNVEIGGRVITLSGLTFHTGGGQGRMTGRVDLTGKSPRLAADVSLSGVGVQSVVAHLPAALRGARGSMSVSGHIETTGLSEQELRENLEGRAMLTIKELSLAGFDPVGAFVKLAGEGALEPLRGPVSFRPVTLNLQIHEQRVILRKTTLELSGARLNMAGSQAFDGLFNLHVAAELQRLRRRWLSRADEPDPQTPPPELDFSGPLDKLAPVSHSEVSRARE